MSVRSWTKCVDFRPEWVSGCCETKVKDFNNYVSNSRIYELIHEDQCTMDESDDYDYPDDEVEFPDVDGDFHDSRSVAGDEELQEEEEEKKVPAKKKDPRMTFLFNKIDELIGQSARAFFVKNIYL